MNTRAFRIVSVARLLKFMEHQANCVPFTKTGYIGYVLQFLMSHGFLMCLGLYGLADWDYTTDG